MQIGIIGLGLIGGSILRGLLNFGHKINVVTRNKNTIDSIKNLVNEVSDDYEVLKNCDFVFVCTPINNVLETLDKLENIVSKNCIVTDVASVKEFVTKKKRPYRFIPSHPMAGTENSGYEASFDGLFKGAKWVLTPYDYDNLDTITEIIESLGAIPIIADAKEHDIAVAMISHLPMYISQCLFAMAKDNQLAMKLAASGFRDTTRIAGTNLTLAKDMLKFNRENIDFSAKEFQNIFENLKNNYTDDVLLPIQQKRRNMYSQDGKNLL